MVAHFSTPAKGIGVTEARFSLLWGKKHGDKARWGYSVTFVAFLTRERERERLLASSWFSEITK